MLACLRRSLLAPALLCCASGLATAQTTWYVDPAGTPPGTGTLNNPYTSLQFAIDQATTVTGDTLLLAPGVYAEHIDYKQKGIAVRGQTSPDQTVIQAITSGTVVRLPTRGSPAGVLANVTVQGLVGANTTGVFGGQARLENSIVRGHSTTGVLADSMTIIRCTVVSNGAGLRLMYTVQIIFSVFADSSVFWGNNLDVEESVKELGGLNRCIWSFSAIHNQVGFGNLAVDPKFWNLAGGDLRPAPGSPCINSGNPSLPPDPDGSIADRGAQTYVPSYVPAPAVYCSAKPASQGCLAAIGYEGSASLSSPAAFLVRAFGVVNNQNGLLIYGLAPQAMPFQGGQLCLVAPTRTPLQQSGSAGGACTGSFAFDMNGWAQSGSDPALTAGSLVYAQYWFRDPADPAGFGSGLSDALEFGLGL